MTSEDLIMRLVITEAALETIERENKLVFIVARKANKHMIRRAIERLYAIKVMKVNTTILPTGEKKAYITLRPEFKASDIATKLGVF
ncbi:MAG: 50S ribosomal protein L23 [Candidatus Atabeyarchaeum deiterrae]|jgi:large subunit ribosomal protein L23